MVLNLSIPLFCSLASKDPPNLGQEPLPFRLSGARDLHLQIMDV